MTFTCYSGQEGDRHCSFRDELSVFCQKKNNKYVKNLKNLKIKKI